MPRLFAMFAATPCFVFDIFAARFRHCAMPPLPLSGFQPPLRQPDFTFSLMLYASPLR